MAEEITFSGLWHEDLQPMEWLQYIADSFSGLADLWDGYDSDYFEDEFEEYKVECPDISKLLMYEDISQRVGESLLHAYIYDSMDLAKEIEHLRENMLKAFANKVIFPNLLKAIGIIEDVMKVAKDAMDYYDNSLYYKHYLPITPTLEDIEDIIKSLGLSPSWAKRVTEKHELTVEDYEDAFEYITELLETIEKKRFSAKLRESAWAIKGYCKLNAESPEKYAEIEAEIAKTKSDYASVDIRRVLAYLLEEFKQIKNYDAEIFYTKAVISEEDDIRVLWHHLFTPLKREKNITIWPNYTEYALQEYKRVYEPIHFPESPDEKPVDLAPYPPELEIQKEENTIEDDGEKPFTMAFGALYGRNVIEGEQLLQGPVRMAIRLLLLQHYYPQKMPDSDTFLKWFPHFAAQRAKFKSYISYQKDEDIVFWYEFLLKLSLEHGSLLEGDKPTFWSFPNISYDPIIQELKTDVLKASILVLEYLIEKVPKEYVNAAETEQVKAPYLSITDLIKHFKIHKSKKEVFRKKIERARSKNTYGDGFFREIANPRVNEPKYEYKTEKVALVVKEMKRSNVQRVSNKKKSDKK